MLPLINNETVQFILFLGLKYISIAANHFKVFDSFSY